MSKYEEAKRLIAEVNQWATDGFPGASLEQLVEMTSMEPEINAEKARARAARNVELLLAGCWEIREELAASNVPPEYRLAVYKERLGVRKGIQAFKLMEGEPNNE